ncbi:MFS transporter [Oscillatoria sp. FACHB-1406]|uniref:MFS transporter n=1 Tax=Oscillatoria sp. FACHB-1406 TaxID=2692846 RepID=UPI001685CF4A|nr:MFS transporter [Oscillatoria sp. FACHB-1406]MBD2578821.1 MFS transporter [Oscillatoria sp. FACHB-1406]
MLKTPSLPRPPFSALSARFKPILEVISQSAIAPTDKPTKAAIRTSLKASTLDGVLSTLFSGATSGVLLSNFLLDLGATNIEIGLLAASPMIANFLQPVGAYLADRATSRRNYILGLFLPSRLLWLTLVVGLIFADFSTNAASPLIHWTVMLALVTNAFGALGGASWVSWMMAIVPRRLRGRYFGFRNSAASLSDLLGLPLLGFFISHWGGGSLQGYSFVLTFAIIAGLLSLICQAFKVDFNPQAATAELAPDSDSKQPNLFFQCFKDVNFLKFILYYGLLMFALNLSGPFFSIYLLKEVGLELSQVTLYGSLMAGANLVMLMRWGKLADRIGSRPILLCAGIAVALLPLLWIGTGNNPLCIWLGFPALYIALGATWSAMDLCNNNLQMALAASPQPSSYFAIAGATAGLCSALGTTVGGFLAESHILGGFAGLFALSAVLRLIALLPLVFVRE